MDSKSGGAGSSDPNSGEGPSSATAPTDQSSSPAPLSRYESGKRRDWNTFSQYLKNSKPPLTLARCSGATVMEFLNYLGQFGKTKVHNTGCPYFGYANPPAPRACPIKHGESSGSGGRAGEERNGGGGDENQGIGGGVGGGGQREGIGTEWRGNRGLNHGGGNGDDDGNDRGGWVSYIEGERRRMGPRPDRMAEILLLLDAEIIGTLGSLDIRGLSARARILRVFSLGFTSVALVCLSASIGQRRTNPILASIFCWIGSAATLLGFFLMIAMAFSASFIP